MPWLEDFNGCTTGWLSMKRLHWEPSPLWHGFGSLWKFIIFYYYLLNKTAHINSFLQPPPKQVSRKLGWTPEDTLSHLLWREGTLEASLSRFIYHRGTQRGALAECFEHGGTREAIDPPCPLPKSTSARKSLLHWFDRFRHYLTFPCTQLGFKAWHWLAIMWKMHVNQTNEHVLVLVSMALFAFFFFEWLQKLRVSLNYLLHFHGPFLFSSSFIQQLFLSDLPHQEDYFCLQSSLVPKKCDVLWIHTFLQCLYHAWQVLAEKLKVTNIVKTGFKYK